MRHRTFSYNEESGRYRTLEPVFYVPGPDRKLIQSGKPGAYVFTDGSAEQHALVAETVQAACWQSYQAYLEMLAEQMETLWAGLMPLTHAAFERNGRVCP